MPLINQFVYRPDVTQAPPDHTPADLGLAYEEVAVETEDGVRLSGWYLPGRGEPVATLLYCHGNAGDIRDWVGATPPFVEAGVSVLIWDYRGYGRSGGRPSEHGLWLDGVVMYSCLYEKSMGEDLPIFLLGKSLGSAVALHLAATHAGTDLDPAGLILDSAFTSMREVIAGIAPVPVHLLPSLYENIELVPAVACPTLVIHGGRDQLVPLSQGQRIYETLSAPKALEVIEQAGHNDIAAYPRYHRSLLAFIRDPAGFTA